MKKLAEFALGLVLSVALPPSVQAAELNWLEDMPKALEQAKTENKTVLINFTGSDWCGYCKKLDQEVYQTREFAAFAQKNLVLVKADFPRSVSQTPALKKSNQDLKTKYATPFKGYPTTVLVNAVGRKLGETVGYAPNSGPGAFLKELRDILKK